MKIAGSFLLLLIAVSGFMVVRTRDVTAQTLALSFYGLLLAVMFFFFQAPDVALSQIVVGAVALPLIIMLAIARMKHKEKTKSSEGGQ
jgi:energy-converting hydrogenase B subunit D